MRPVEAPHGEPVPGAGDAHLLRRRLEGLLGIPATEGNRLTLLRNGDQIFPAMLSAIEDAQRSIDFLTFVYWRGDIAREFAHALAAAAGRGVRCRVLLDAVGGRLMDKGLVAHMADRGVQVEWFRPPLSVAPWKHNHRTHRKVLVVDERLAFTGGVGIAEEWCGDARDETEWRDTHVLVEGPAVDGLKAAFAQDWAETGHPLLDPLDTFPEHVEPGDSVVQVARGAASVGWNDMATVFRVMIEAARSRLRVTTAYFVPDEDFCRLFVEAVERGVHVQVLLPGPHADKRVCRLASESVYASLMDAGVEISTFQPSMLHAKILTVDGIACVLGSANLNSRSLRLDDEVVLSVFDARVTAELDQHFDEDLARSERMVPGRWEHRPLPQRVGEQLSRVAHRWL